MTSRSKLGTAIAITTVAILLAIFVWPTRYAYYTVGAANVLVRRDRLTGNVERIPVGQTLANAANVQEQRPTVEGTVIQQNGKKCVDILGFAFLNGEPVKPRGAEDLPWCKELKDNQKSQDASASTH